MTLLARRALSALTSAALLAGLFLGAPASALATPQTYYVGHQVNDYALGSACADPNYWTDGDWTGGGAYNSNNDAIQDATDNAASGSIIYICAGTYVFAEEITVAAGVSLTFRGEGDETVLDGNDITRIFNSSPVNESDQGGVLSLGDLLIMDAEVTSWNAGAIVSDGLSLDSVTITRTTGAYNGGALYAEGNVTIVDSTFTGNIAIADGGVLYAWNSDRTVSISNSVFDGNTAYTGGAIAAATISVTNSTFTGNTAAYYGGAINATTATVSSSTFTDNSAVVGGAIAAATISVTNSTFSGSYAYYGGAIYAYTTATVTSSTFTGNGSFFAGAISAAAATVTNSTFTGNTAAYIGGAINATTATVSSSTFTDNSAVVGGAISTDTATVTNSTFTDNDAGILAGAISAAAATVTNSTFTGNTAAYWGGAIYASTATIARSRFTRNTAGEHGGAVNLPGPTSNDLRKWRRNTFSRNTAALGGAITLGSCVAPSRSQAARVLGANRFSGNRATEQRRTKNIERRAGDCS